MVSPGFVPPMGFEPTSPFGHQGLSLARLPFRQRGIVAAECDQLILVGVRHSRIPTLRADDRDRTGDLHLGKVPRYQLRHIHISLTNYGRDSGSHGMMPRLRSQPEDKDLLLPRTPAHSLRRTAPDDAWSCWCWPRSCRQGTTVRCIPY